MSDDQPIGPVQAYHAPPLSLDFLSWKFAIYYSFIKEHSHQFWSFYALLFSSQEPAQDRRTDGRTDKTRNAAYWENRIITFIVSHHNMAEQELKQSDLSKIPLHAVWRK